MAAMGTDGGARDGCKLLPGAVAVHHQRHCHARGGGRVVAGRSGGYERGDKEGEWNQDDNEMGKALPHIFMADCTSEVLGGNITFL